jgi:hypothetical protein
VSSPAHICLLKKETAHRLTTEMLFSGIALFASAVVIAVVAELTARGKLSVNGGAGLRIPSVMASPEAWLAGHRAARVWLHLSAASLAVPALLCVMGPSEVANIALLIGMVVAVVLLLIGTMRAHRAASLVAGGQGRMDDTSGANGTD